MKEALYYEVKDPEMKIAQCVLCPHRCIMAVGKAGICRARKNDDGKVVSLTYNKFTSIGVDPIEKKPLYHFYPGSQILSVGTFGCNFRCSFCQNWEISQAAVDEIPVSEMTSQTALELARKNRSIGIAYTYNEPLINFEWVRETSEIFQNANLKNVLVTNGYINEPPLKELIPFIDAANVDIKFFNEAVHKRMTNGSLEPVKKTIELLVKNKVHVELTNLIIPGENDKGTEIDQMARWVAGLNKSIPLHFSRYFPSYKLKTPATEIKTLTDAYNIAKKHLKNVYIGNINDYNYANTNCEVCGEVLVSRNGYNVNPENLEKNKCKKCGAKVNIIT